jgi:hypothetical protein
MLVLRVLCFGMGARRIMSRYGIVVGFMFALCVFSPLVTLAETPPFESRFYKAWSRTFDLREPQMIYPDDSGFWTGGVPWLDEFLRSDSLLKHVSFIIESASVDFDHFVLLTSNDSSFPVNGTPDPKYDIPGYDIYWNGKTNPRLIYLVFVSKNDPIGHVVNCGDADENGVFLACFVRARYAADSKIQLRISMPRPIPGLSDWEAPSWEETWPTFLPIANRAREVAHCLDVTDLINAGITPDNAPPKDPSKFLDECRIKLTN